MGKVFYGADISSTKSPRNCSRWKLPRCTGECILKINAGNAWDYLYLKIYINLFVMFVVCLHQRKWSDISKLQINWRLITCLQQCFSTLFFTRKPFFFARASIFYKLGWDFLDIFLNFYLFFSLILYFIRFNFNNNSHFLNNGGRK